MKNIKTRRRARDIKTLDKSASAAQRMRKAYVGGKELMPQATTREQSDENPEQFAETIVDKAAQRAYTSGRRRVMMAREKQRAVADIKTADKGTARTAGKTVKTTERFYAIKTTAYAKHMTQKSAERAVKQAERTVQTVQQAKKTVAATTKAVKKAMREMTRAAMAAARAMLAAMGVGGGFLVVVIAAAASVAMLFTSVFGIFFSSEKTSESLPTMQEVVREINDEYFSELDGIQSDNSHELLEMSGSRASWKEVLAVYAVKTNLDTDDGQEVLTLDSNKQELLREVFWDMHEITFTIETKDVQESIISEDEDGNEVEELETVSKEILFIIVTHKTADEMVEEYSFDDEKEALLTELLDVQYDDLWRSVLYGIQSGEMDMVVIAISQLGNLGGAPYWSWYGFTERVEWCACFVSWCANECGYIDTGVIPRFSSCTLGKDWFESRGQWQESDYVPAPGDLIFLDWESDGVLDHVGIVEFVDEDGYVHTIEGNSGNAVRQRVYALDSNAIYGYGVPIY